MRAQVHQKYGGRCAYCGTEITVKQMQMDHFKPIYRNWGDTHPLPEHAGTDTIDNLMPACAPCNRWKSTMPLEDFRAELVAQVERLRRDSAAFRMAERHGLVVPTGNPVVFWFEKFENQAAEGGI
jgi:5-methylcytosine-specific restriction endonuclease McrA